MTTFGLIVRSKGFRTKHWRIFQELGGRGDQGKYQPAEAVRHQAIERLSSNAKNLGANAVISVDFDTSEIGKATTEVLAYGTAVVIEKDTGKAQSVTLT